MEPGRELDALIAEKVMGYRRCDLHRVYNEPVFHFEGQTECSDNQVCNFFPITLAHENIGHYSTDIAAAWEVVEKWYELNGSRGQTGVRISILSDQNQTEIEVEFDDEHDFKFEATAKTLPHAICLAALKAVEGK